MQHGATLHPQWKMAPQTSVEQKRSEKSHVQDIQLLRGL